MARIREDKSSTKSNGRWPTLRAVKTLAWIVVIFVLVPIVFGDEKQTVGEAWQDFLDGFRFIGAAIRERGFTEGLRYSFFGDGISAPQEMQQ